MEQLVLDVQVTQARLRRAKVKGGKGEKIYLELSSWGAALLHRPVMSLNSHPEEEVHAEVRQSKL